jgi:hypothetical protein
VVSHRPLNAEARVPFQTSPLDVVHEVTLGQVSLRILRFPPVSIINYYRRYLILARGRDVNTLKRIIHRALLVLPSVIENEYSYLIIIIPK